MKSLEIFRAGNHVSANGQALQFTESDLVACAAAYSPSLHEAPIVIGHPKHDDPAYGWVESLDVSNGSFWANPKQIDPEFAEAVKAGKFKKISASFYAPDSPSNPVQGVYYLRHVGFLGAMPPSVKGMQPVHFAEAEEGIIEFSELDFMDWDDMTIAGLFSNLREWMISKFDLETADRVVPIYAIDELKMSALTPSPSPTLGEGDMNYSEGEQPVTIDFAEREAAFAAREAEIAKREAKVAELEFSEYVNSLIADGKVYPREKPQILATLAKFSGITESLEFSEGDETKSVSLIDSYKQSLENRPKVVEFAEIGQGVDPVDFSDPEAQAKEIEKAYQKALSDGNPITFAEAQNIVLASKY